MAGPRSPGSGGPSSGAAGGKAGESLASVHANLASLGNLTLAATDPQTLAALKELGYLSAPVVCVGVSNDDIWSGYRPDRIEEIAKRIHGA